MKKLVKTAKQQFEERLSKLDVVSKDEYGSNMYYLCEDNCCRCIILYNAEDNSIYEEIGYDGTLLDIYNHEDFLENITNHWLEYNGGTIKRLFDWYASADKENPPFSIGVIAECASNGSVICYEDLYKEVPDVQIVSAREQFERRLEEVGLLQAWYDQCSVGRIGIVDKETKRVLVFVHEDYSDGYTEFVYPPFEELRKDSKFCVECLGELIDNCDDMFLKAVSLWIYKGGNCPLDPVDVYFSANHLRLEETTDFEDKTISQEQPTIEQLLTLTPEQQEAVKMIEEGCKLLKERGGSIISYFDENDYYVVNGNGLDLFCDDRHNDEAVDISAILCNHSLKFSWDAYWGYATSFFAKPKN